MATSVMEPARGAEVPKASAPARVQLRGVMEALPPGEKVRWDYTPDAKALTRHLLFVRPLAGYFAVMVAWWMFSNRGEIGSSAFWTTAGVQLALALMVLGGVVAVGRWIASSTVYAITDRRLVMRLGIIFPLTVNVPLRYVQGAKVKVFADGTGQIALQLDPKERLAWIVLFPHVRPWEFAQPEPLLRGLTDPQRVGEILREAALAVPPVDAAPAAAAVND